MKKIFTQKFPLFFLLLVGIAIVVNSCQQDDVSMEKTFDKPETKNISWQEFVGEISNKPNADKVLAKVKPTSLINPLEKATFGGYEVDDSEILRIQNEETVGFTMKIVDEVSQSTKNLFVYNSDGVIEYNIISYTPNEDCMNRTLVDSDTYFTGDIKIDKEGEEQSLILTINNTNTQPSLQNGAHVIDAEILHFMDRSLIIRWWSDGTITKEWYGGSGDTGDGGEGIGSGAGGGTGGSGSGGGGGSGSGSGSGSGGGGGSITLPPWLTPDDTPPLDVTKPLMDEAQEDKVVIDESLDNTVIDCILTKMMQIDSAQIDSVTQVANLNLFQKILKKFDEQESGGIVFKFDENLNTTARTLSYDGGSTFQIVFSSELNSLPNIFIESVIIHELIHALMLKDLNNWGLIAWPLDNSGLPIISSSAASICQNNNYFSNNYEQHIAALFCLYLESPPANSIPSQWIHDLFNMVGDFDMDSYLVQISNYIKNNHDWNSETEAWKTTQQLQFGTNWKYTVSQYIHMDGLRLTSKFNEWWVIPTGTDANYFHNNIIESIIRLGKLPGETLDKPAKIGCL